MKISIGIIDDHLLFTKSLSLLLSGIDNFDVIIEAMNGRDMQEKMKFMKALPDIMLIDVEMAVMDGVETAAWLTKTHPVIRLAALSMNDTDKKVISMIKAGCCAYLLKDTHPNELEKALNEIAEKGYYNADVSNINYRRLIQTERDEIHLSEKEKEFLIYACSDLTYKQIADKMNQSERTIDGYREKLFQKFKVQSRVGLALEAVRKGFVKL